MPPPQTRTLSRRLLATAALLVVLAGAAVLGWYFPARWAMPWLAPRLHGLVLNEVQGSLWRGRAGRVALPQGQVLGRASWDVSRRVVFTPVPIRLEVDGPALRLTGNVRLLSGGRSAWRDLTLATDLGAWPAVAAVLPGPAHGAWHMTVSHALLEHGWPLELELTAQWRDATLAIHGVPVELGDLDVDARAKAGVVAAHVASAAGSPLDAAGDLLLGPLGWRFTARLRASAADPALRHWLAGLGPADAAGFVHVERHAGLALQPVHAPSRTGATTGQ